MRNWWANGLKVIGQLFAWMQMGFIADSARFAEIRLRVDKPSSASEPFRPELEPGIPEVMLEEAMAHEESKNASPEEQKNACVKFDLGTALTINEVEETHKQLRTLLESNAQAFEINGSELEQTDTAGVQLLFAFAREASSRHVPVYWSTPGDSLMKSAKALGLRDELFA